MTTTETDLAPWQRVFRDGFAPHLPREGLRALAKALREDDPRLLQYNSPFELAEGDIRKIGRVHIIGFCLIDWDNQGNYTELLRRIDDVSNRIIKSIRDHWCIFDFNSWYNESARAEAFRQSIEALSVALEATTFN